MHGCGVPHRPSGAEVLWQKDALHVSVKMDRREKKRENVTDLGKQCDKKRKSKYVIVEHIT